ncbi:hypothetical protein C8J57DRAFT_1232765 [Mycena rebaudengoi]|nr:hypothetical protein C8J57DRAFT_1232765 [Mycena rebaudengoi]
MPTLSVTTLVPLVLPFPIQPSGRPSARNLGSYSLRRRGIRCPDVDGDGIRRTSAAISSTSGIIVMRCTYGQADACNYVFEPPDHPLVSGPAACPVIQFLITTSDGDIVTTEIVSDPTAISPPSPSSSSTSTSTGGSTTRGARVPTSEMAGAIVGSFMSIAIIGFLLWLRRRRRRTEPNTIPEQFGVDDSPVVRGTTGRAKSAYLVPSRVALGRSMGPLPNIEEEVRAAEKSGLVSTPPNPPLEADVPSSQDSTDIQALREVVDLRRQNERLTEQIQELVTLWTIANITGQYFGANVPDIYLQYTDLVYSKYTGLVYARYIVNKFWPNNEKGNRLAPTPACNGNKTSPPEDCNLLSTANHNKGTNTTEVNAALDLHKVFQYHKHSQADQQPETFAKLIGASVQVADLFATTGPFYVVYNGKTESAIYVQNLSDAEKQVLDCPHANAHWFWSIKDASGYMILQGDMNKIKALAFVPSNNTHGFEKSKLHQSGTQPIFSHIWDLSGIIDTIYGTNKIPEYPQHQIGWHASYYLHAHGYTASSIDEIASIWAHRKVLQPL